MKPKSTTFDAFRLARERGRLSGDATMKELPRLAQAVLSVDARVHYEIVGTVDDKGHPGALMRLTARLPLRCERCNEPVEFVLDRTVPFRFVASEEALNAIPIEDDELEAVVGSHAMALLPWIEDEAILSLPLIARHNDCSTAILLAGAEQPMERENPFAALANLKKGGDGGSSKH
jgi:DUF177 domain-containing protein